MAYGMDRKKGEVIILVFDLGGATFDVTVTVVDNGIFENLAINGNRHLGGEVGVQHSDIYLGVFY